MRKHKQNRNKKEEEEEEEEVIDRDIHHPAYAVYETVVLGFSPPFSQAENFSLEEAVLRITLLFW
jgi:hypothetical protein